MKSVLRLFLFVYLFFLGNTSIAQPFSKSYPSHVLNLNSIVKALNSEIVILKINGTQYSSEKGVVISKLNQTGEFIWSKEIIDLDFRNLNFNKSDPLLILMDGSIVVGTNISTATERKYFITFLESDGNIKWSKYINHDINTLESPTFIQLDTNSFIAIICIRSSNGSKILSIQNFNLNGDLIYEKQQIDFDEDDSDEYIFNNLGGGKIAIIKNSTNICAVSVMDEKFNLLESFEISMNVKQVLSIGDDYYLYGANLPFNIFSNRSVITKLNSNKEIAWSKTVDLVSGFRIYDLMIQDGIIIYRTIDQTNFIGVLLKISVEGEFVEGRALQYEELNPILGFSLFNDNQFLDLIHQNGTHVIYSDLLNFSGKCYKPNICVELLDNTITSQSGSSFSLNPYDLNIFLESFDLNSETFSEEALDFCFTPNFSIPTPFFIIDDTVCINEIIEFYNLENTDADDVTWSAPGSSIENSQSYVLDNLTYLNPGKYEITQSINTDGCTSEFTREIVVVPPVEHNLTTDLILCDSVAYLIDARTEGVIDYLWNNGATSENLLTEEKGIYSVLMSDLYCTQNVTFNIDYFNYDEIKVGLGNDTVICIQYPLSTNIILSDTTEFTWNDNYLNLNREFLETGYYELITSLNGCKSITGITVTVEDCSAQLYLPNAFSPNQDGINDSFFPLGDFFEVLDFRIYDRWGSEVHSGNTAWKGNTKNKQSSMGVYHYVLRIRNTLLDAEELITGDVTLIR